MKVFYIVCIVLFCSCESSSNSSKNASFVNHRTEIQKVLDQQVNTWNAFDLEGLQAQNFSWSTAHPITFYRKLNQR